MPSIADVRDIKKPVENVNSSMNSIEKKVREAAVKVTKPFTGGHGSGSYILYKDLNLVITASNVTLRVRLR